MQEASGPPYRVVSLGLKPRLRGQSPRVKSSFKFWGATSHFATCSGPSLSLNPGAKPFDQFALLLFALPSVFTLQKLLLFVALTERSHQLQAVPSGLALKKVTLSQPPPPCGGSRSNAFCHSPRPPGAGRARCLPASSTLGTPFRTLPFPQRSCSPRPPSHSRT